MNGASRDTSGDQKLQVNQFPCGKRINLARKLYALASPDAILAWRKLLCRYSRTATPHHRVHP